jgi:hypothetical protein
MSGLNERWSRTGLWHNVAQFLENRGTRLKIARNPHDFNGLDVPLASGTGSEQGGTTRNVPERKRLIRRALHVAFLLGPFPLDLASRFRYSVSSLSREYSY